MRWVWIVWRREEVVEEPTTSAVQVNEPVYSITGSPLSGSISTAPDETYGWDIRQAWCA